MPDNNIERPTNLVKISDMSFERSGRIIFDNISLNIPKGKITVIMGPSGTGKTTLLRLIGGELEPRTGSINVNQHELRGISQKDLYEIRRQMGFLFQQGALFTNLNVFENVAFPLREHTNLSEEFIYYLVSMKLESVGLRGARHLKTTELSGGMARRVALARAFVLDPKLMMYDEPFTGQDPIARGVVLQLIKKLNDSLQLTSIVVSHDVVESAHIADYIFVLSGGNIIGEGTPDQIMTNTTPQVNQFVHGLPDGPVSFKHPAKPFLEELEL